MADNVLHFEPDSALFVDDQDPLIYYRAIASFCRIHLETKGFVWVEINENLGKETAAIFKYPIFSEVTIIKDIHGKERFIKARKK
jgi:release factor glutamine methyltransferase